MLMIQFYFLSIFLNALTGYLLITDGGEAALKFNSDFSLKDENVKFIAGIASVAAAILKILSPIDGDIPILGDIIPSITGFLAGMALILEYRKNRAAQEDGNDSGKAGSFFAKNRKIIGAAALIAAALHFLFPKVLLL